MTCKTTKTVEAPLRLKIEKTRNPRVICFRTTKDLLPEGSAYREGRYRASELPGLIAVFSGNYRPDLQFMLREILYSQGVDHIFLRKYEVNVAFNPVFEVPEVYAAVRDAMLTYLPRDTDGLPRENVAVEVTDSFDPRGMYVVYSA